MSEEHNIPPEFWSDLTGKPFTHCTLCEKELSSVKGMYMVEKAIKIQNGYRNTVFEYAICRECAQQRTSKLSAESLERIQQFFTENRQELPQRMTYSNRQMKQFYTKCCVTGKNVNDVEEYQLACQFHSGIPSYMAQPIMISGEVINQLQELLSEQTKDEFDDFMDDIYTGPPELKELFKGRPVLV